MTVDSLAVLQKFYDAEAAYVRDTAAVLDVLGAGYEGGGAESVSSCWFPAPHRGLEGSL